MPNIPGPEPAESNAPADILSLLTAWMNQGIESFSATQRIFEDVAMRQSAMVAGTAQKEMNNLDSSASILAELAVRGTASFIEAQKILLKLTQEENDIFTNAVEGCIGESAPRIAAAELMRRTLNTFVRLQQEFLKTTTRQFEVLLQAATNGPVPQPTEVAELARQEVEKFVEAQNKFLDLVAQAVTKGIGGKREPMTKEKKTVLSKLAHQATTAFIEAQERMLSVFSQQMKVNLKAASQTMRVMSNGGLVPITSLTREGLQNFMAAERALIDALVKPGRRKSASK